MQAGLEVLPPLYPDGGTGPGASGAPRATAAPEDVPEQIAEIVDSEPAAGRAAASRPGERAPGRSQPATLVVLLAAGSITQHVVGGRDLLEPVLGTRVGVRMVPLGQLAVGLADLLVGGGVGHAQHL